MTARELALNVLYKIEVGEGYSNITLDKELNRHELSKVDKALVSEIVYGVLTWKIKLDEIIKRYSSIRLKKISPWILNILRMGIYQIAFLDKIPTSAAVNESVKLAKKYGHEVSSKFANAILRKIEKNEVGKLEEYLETLSITEEEKISILTSHPLWIVEKLIDEYEDVEFVKALLDSNNKTPEVTIRVNTLKTTREEVKRLLDLKKVECRLGNCPDSIILKNYFVLNESLAIVQDEAAQLACIKLNPKENEIVLDACSSPGGKTTYLSQLMKNTGRIDAWDIHEHRVALVKKIAEKLGCTNIRASEKDASEYHTEYRERYDKVLLDVPCSGLGVIRKKPDIKWTRSDGDIEELVEIQKNILECGAQYVRSGGTLVYSTCTVLKEENENQIKMFLEKHREFELVDETKLFPNVDLTDGFYIAKMVKE